MRVVGYIRVSTREQAERGLSLPDQERTLRQWAKDNGHRLVRLCVDAGVSGSNGLSTRDGLAEALEALRLREADGMVVLRLDRFARDLMVQEQVLADVWRLGAVLFSTSAAESGYLDDDPDDPARKLIRQVLGAVVEYEKNMVALRLRAGRRRKADKGGFAYGSPAFGQQAKDGELVPDEREAAALDRIRQLHADGISLRGMAATLTAEGHKPKRSEVWHPQSLARIVARL